MAAERQQHYPAQPDSEELRLSWMYDEYCNELRASLLQELFRHHVVENGAGLAIYETAAEAGNLASADGTISILAAVLPLEESRKVGDHFVPTVHLMTNERIESDEERIQWLTKEFVLTSRNTARFGIGVLSEPEEGETISIGHAAFFHISDGKVQTTRNIGLLPPMQTLSFEATNEDNETETQFLYPFGRRENIDDQFDAVAAGFEIVSMLGGLEPQFRTNHTY